MGFWLSFSYHVHPTGHHRQSFAAHLGTPAERYGLDRVAKRLQVKEERIAEWEAGERQPTLRQVESLARMFHRPLRVFFMPRPPQLAPLAMEYRRLPGVEPGHESPELRLALRQMLARRENALNLMEELGQEIPEFTLRASLMATLICCGPMGPDLMGLPSIPYHCCLGTSVLTEGVGNYRATACQGTDQDRQLDPFLVDGIVEQELESLRLVE